MRIREQKEGQRAGNSAKQSATLRPPAVAGLQSLTVKATAKILIGNPPPLPLDIITPPAEHPQGLQTSLPDKKIKKK